MTAERRCIRETAADEVVFRKAGSVSDAADLAMAAVIALIDAGSTKMILIGSKRQKDFLTAALFH